MLWATARSVREEKSKQRHALQEFSRVRVSLVRGRSGWRVGSVEAVANYYAAAPTREARGAATSIIRLLRQFLHGEEPQPVVFAESIAALERTASATTNEAVCIVDLFRLRFLHQLGYIAPAVSFDALLSPSAELVYQGPRPLPPPAAAAVANAELVSHL